MKKRRHTFHAVAALTVIVLITVGVSRLEPAAPQVDRDTIYLDTVQRGPMVRRVRGTGTLVPEQIRWIPAATDGAVERIVIRPGAPVDEPLRENDEHAGAEQQPNEPTDHAHLKVGGLSGDLRVQGGGLHAQVRGDLPLQILQVVVCREVGGSGLHQWIS